MAETLQFVRAQTPLPIAVDEEGAQLRASTFDQDEGWCPALVQRYAPPALWMPDEEGIQLFQAIDDEGWTPPNATTYDPPASVASPEESSGLYYPVPDDEGWSRPNSTSYAPPLQIAGDEEGASLLVPTLDDDGWATPNLTTYAPPLEYASDEEGTQLRGSTVEEEASYPPFPVYPWWAPTWTDEEVLNFIALVHLSGTSFTCDGTGVIPNATVLCFRTSDDVLLASTTSDVSGNFTVAVPMATQCFFLMYSVGPPFVAGTTRNDLVGS